MTETLQNPALIPVVPEGSVDPLSHRKRILLVEGDGFTRLVLIFLFRLAGFGVDFTSNGTLALAKLRASPHDALLVELKLLGVSGLELIRNARREAKFGDRPIYIFTNADEMSGAAHKEARKTESKVFDKRFISLSELVQSIAADFPELEAPDLEAPQAQALDQSSGVKPDSPLSKPPSNSAPPANIDAIIGGVREQCALWLKASGPGERLGGCEKLLSRLRSLLSCAEAASLRNLARQAKALEAFINHIYRGRQNFEERDLTTIRQAEEVLALIAAKPAGEAKELVQFTVAILDESPVSAGNLSDAFLKAGITPVPLQNPAHALTYLASNPVNIVIVNVGLPELHGFDTAQISQHPLLSTTPIIFISESSPSNDSSVAEPAEAPLVTANSPLLTGLVMKTLNELQSQHRPQTRPKSASPPPAKPAQQVAAPISQTARQDEELDSFSWPTIKPMSQSTPAMPDLPVAAAQPSIGAEPACAVPDVQPQSLNDMQATDPASPMTILFVEDDPFVLKIYSKALMRAGFRVESAEDGLVALELLPLHRPALVVLDLMLPKVHGLEVLEFIRSDSSLQEIPVIVLSNAYVDQLAARAEKAGANLGLPKTQCSPGKLVQHVCELLQRPTPVASLDAGLDAAEAMPAAVEVVPETDIWVRQADMRQQAPKEVAKIRDLCLSCIKAVDSEKNSLHLSELYRRIRFLTAHAALIGFTKIAEVSSVLEGLLFEIMLKQWQPTNSTFQTIAQTVDFLDQLVQTNDTTFAEPRLYPKVLVVDGDAAGYVATVTGLQRGHFDVVATQDPLEGIRMLRSNRFDAVTLDVNMPYLNGFEVCQQLRRLPQYQSIPVIFFSANIELQDRARSVMSGGNDLLPKSASPLELVLRLTIHTLKPNGQGPAVNARLRGIAPTQKVAQDPDASWVITDDATPPQPQVAPESFTPVPATSPDQIMDRVAAASPACEPFEASPAGLAAPEAQEENSPQFGLGTVTERQTEEPYGAVTQGLVPVSESPDDPVFQPAPKAEQAEREWLVPKVGVEAEPASPGPLDAQNKGKQSPITPAVESTEPEEQGQLVPQARQAASEWQPFVPQIPSVSSDVVSAKQSQSTPSVESQALEGLAQPVPRARQAATEWQPFVPQVPSVSPHVASGVGAEAQTLPEIDPAHGTPAPESPATPTIEQEALARQLQALQAELAKQSEAVAKYAQERESLVNRIVDAQNDLHRREVRLQRKDEAIEKLQKQLDAIKTQPPGSASADSVASDDRLKQLEEQLSQRAEELEQAKAETAIMAHDRELGESDLRQQLEASALVAAQSANAQQQAQARCDQLDQELTALRQAREHLDSRVATEQEASAESAKRIKELEEQSCHHAAELERAKAEAAKLATDREQGEADLRQQLEASARAAAQSAAAQQQVQTRCDQLDQELTALRQARELLDSQVAKEQHASAESAKRIKELEGQSWHHAAELERAKAESAKKVTEHEERSSRHAAELERVKAEAEKQAQEREHAASDLRRQLEAAGLGAAKSATAHELAQARCDELEKELAGLRQTRESLNTQVAKEQQVTADSARRIKELEEQSSRHAADSERTKAEAGEQAKERERVEADLRRQLEAAGATAAQSTSAHQQAQARCGRLEKELAGLRQAREQLNTQCGQLEQELDGLRQAREKLHIQVAKEQQVSADSARQIKALEEQSSRHAGDLERATAEAAKNAKDRELAESDLRRQLEASELAASKSAGAVKQAQARSAQLEQELAGLRQAREKLNAQVAKEQQGSADSSRRIKELEKQSASNKAGLERARADAAKQAKERELVESDLRRQVEAASTAAAQSAAAHQQIQARCEQLDQELASLREARENLTSQLAKEQQISTDSAKRVKDLDEQLSQRAAEIERANAEAAKQAKDRELVESDLRRQLEASRLAAAQSAAAHQQAQAASAQFEQELAGLRQTKEELSTSLAKEQHLSAESAKRIKELENQLNEGTPHGQVVELEQRIAAGVASLTRVTADLARERGERQRSEARAAALNQRLQELHAELKRSLEAQRADQDHIGNLEGQVRQRDEALVRQADELEQKESEWRQAEEQLHKSSDLNAHLGQRLSSFDVAHKTLNSTQQDLQSRLDAALNSLQESGSKFQQECAERQRLAAGLEEATRELQNHGRKHGTLETELQATLEALRERESKLQQEAAERQRLAAALDAAQRELQNHGRNRESLESDLKATAQALRESESKAHQEAGERQRLAQALEAAQLNHRDHAQRTEVELSKAQTAVQFEQAERERLEAQMARMRHSTLDTARGARLARSAWRKQMREPVDNLYQSANSLLQLEMTDQQKKLAEGILQDILLVHTRLQEPDVPAADPGAEVSDQ